MNTSTKNICDGCAHDGKCPHRATRASRDETACEFFEPRDPGICATCAIRATCEKRRVPGGVWHCADYK